MFRIDSLSSKPMRDDEDRGSGFSRGKFLLKTFLLITCVKILLMPTYHSTDFEVHRNWLAVTHNLPIQEWYQANSSQWTLDYPPFFAWFEYLLSQPARHFNPEMLKIQNFNYATDSAKFYQRGTVIVADSILAYGTYKIGNVFCQTDKSFKTLTILMLCNIGLIMIDHIHFQYNGLLLGILLISLADVLKVDEEITYLQGAAWFAILLNFKHLYLYVAPAFGVWLLKYDICRHHTYYPRIVKLAIIGLVIFSLSFFPFRNQLPQVISRLFPFKRGLMHAYWAANFWALYATCDKILALLLKKLGFISSYRIASMTGGLVQQDDFNILPTPPPLATFFITVIFMLPPLWDLYMCRRIKHKLLRTVILCGLSSFMFGWHVHEKAILIAIIPLTVLASTNPRDGKIFMMLSAAGHTAMMPLLFPDELAPLKFILYISYTMASYLLLNNQFRSFTLQTYEFLYVLSLPITTLYESVLHKMIFGEVLAFLPLALTSLHCLVGIVYVYITGYYEIVLWHRNKCNG